MDAVVRLRPGAVEAVCRDETVSIPVPEMQKAQHPERTEAAVRKCFGKLGGSGWSLASLTVEDPEGLFVPTSVLNDLRRELVARLEAARLKRRQEKIASVREALSFDAVLTRIARTCDASPEGSARFDAKKLPGRRARGGNF